MKYINSVKIMALTDYLIKKKTSNSSVIFKVIFNFDHSEKYKPPPRQSGRGYTV